MNRRSQIQPITRLQVTANKAYSNGLELVASFTWSKSIDDSSMYDTNVGWLANYGPESGFALQDPNNPKSERSLSTFDVPAMLKFSYSYDLPFGRGKTFGAGMPRFLDAIIGGWKTNGIWESLWPTHFLYPAAEYRCQPTGRSAPILWASHSGTTAPIASG